MAATISGSIERDVLECPICINPLQPPVYQCVVGHVICSSCHGRLQNKDRCHSCSATGGYNRCNALDKILESFRVPCSNTKYGCTTVSNYHEADGHNKSCLHAPCFCPEHGCGFAGSSITLLAHLTGDHKCQSTELKYNFKLTLEVKVGMHVLLSRDGGSLLLVKFSSVLPIGHVFSVLCIDPHAMEGECKFRGHLGSSSTGMGCQKYLDFKVMNTNLPEGLQHPHDRDYSFVERNTTSITITITKKIMRDKCGTRSD